MATPHRPLYAQAVQQGGSGLVVLQVGTRVSRKAFSTQRYMWMSLMRYGSSTWGSERVVVELILNGYEFALGLLRRFGFARKT